MREYIYCGVPIEHTHSHFANEFVYGSLVKTDDKAFIAVSAMPL